MQCSFAKLQRSSACIMLQRRSKENEYISGSCFRYVDRTLLWLDAKPRITEHNCLIRLKLEQEKSKAARNAQAARVRGALNVSSAYLKGQVVYLSVY
jgi:hypothetical protein